MITIVKSESVVVLGPHQIDVVSCYNSEEMFLKIVNNHKEGESHKYRIWLSIPESVDMQCNNTEFQKQDMGDGRYKWLECVLDIPKDKQKMLFIHFKYSGTKNMEEATGKIVVEEIIPDDAIFVFQDSIELCLISP